MRKFALICVLAAAQLEPAFDLDDPALSEPRPPTNYRVAKYSPSTLSCTHEELCETFPSIADWTPLEDSKYSGKWEVKEHPWLKDNLQLVMTEEMKFYGLSRTVAPWKAGQPLAFSMNARYPEDHNCGGAYVKLYQGSGADLNGQKPYSIMFGPDHCGVATRTVHFIIQYTDPAGDQVEEHLQTRLELPADIKKTHQYGFSLSPKGDLEILIDNQVAASGNIKTLTKPGWKSPETIPDPADVAPENWTPLPRMIPDPSATKPEDWDEDAPEFIQDLDAEKPEDWLDDEPEMVLNEEAEKPEDWSDEEDGEWIRPMKKNPKCVSGCGEWVRPLIPNPDYKGPWTTPMIANPDFTEKYPTRQIPHPNPYNIENPLTVMRPFNSIGMELWCVQAGVALDDFYLGADANKMKKWAKESFEQVNEIETENYAKTPDVDSAPNPKEAEDPHRYVKLAAICIVGLVVVSIAARKLFAPVFRQSDIPKRADDKPVTNENAENAETSNVAEETTEGKDKKHDELETEPSAGETKPTKRN